MPGLLVTCRMCGAEHEPDRDAVLSGAWRVCRPCPADGAPGGRRDPQMELIAAGVEMPERRAKEERKHA